MRPILSICIPTYNRGHVLKDVLEKFITNPEFDDDVELVISDNASSDDTEQICHDACLMHPNIVYHRNEVNIHDENFVRVLDLAKGEYLKLFNDWVYCTEEQLRYIKDKVRENVLSREPLFFTGNHIYTKYKAREIHCVSLDEYVKVVSTFVTYNNIFGVWREQWVDVQGKHRYSALKLQQEDWTYQLVDKRKGCVIYDDTVFNAYNRRLGPRGGYHWFQIHLDNYYNIMIPYIQSGLITRSTFQQDKKNLLWHFRYQLGLCLFFNYTTNWKFETKGTFRLFWKYYSKDVYFYPFLLYLFFYHIYRMVRHLTGVLLRLMRIGL